MTAESGLEHLPGSEGEFESSTITSTYVCIFNDLLLLFGLHADPISQDPETAEPLPDIALLDAKISEATTAIKDAESAGDKGKARERKEDLMRLKRVEQIYVSFLCWLIIYLY